MVMSPLLRSSGLLLLLAFSSIAQVTKFIDDEMLSPLPDGMRAVFYLSKVPVPQASLQLYRSRLLQIRGKDYTISGARVTFRSGIPAVGERLAAWYRYNSTETFPGAYVLPWPLKSIVAGHVGDSEIVFQSRQDWTIDVIKNNLVLNDPLDYTTGWVGSQVVIRLAVPIAKDDVIELRGWWPGNLPYTGLVP